MVYNDPRSLLPTVEDLDAARNANFEETVKKQIIKQTGLAGGVNVNKNRSLSEVLEIVSLPLVVSAKKIPYTEGLLLELYKRPTRTNVWKEYTEERERLDVSDDDSFGLIFSVPGWASTVIFHDYTSGVDAQFCGFGCWIQIGGNSYRHSYFVETLKNFLSKFEPAD